MRIVALAALLAAAPALALAGAHGGAKTATAALKTSKGDDAGTVTLKQTPNGVLLTAELSGLTPGVHGFHIHETGKCDAPDFKSAGGHFNPGDTKHGLLVEGGPHAGDMPNIHFPEGKDATLMVEVMNPRISLEEDGDGYLMDGDGSAIMIHSGGDDYESQPAGDAGSRVVCGVVGATK